MLERKSGKIVISSVTEGPAADSSYAAAKAGGYLTKGLAQKGPQGINVNGISAWRYRFSDCSEGPPEASSASCRWCREKNDDVTTRQHGGLPWPQMRL
jgi:hypothetical protein